MLIFGLGGLMLVVVVAVVASMLGGEDNGQVQQTTTPAPTLTATPQLRTLRSYFGNPTTTATLQPVTAQDDFRNALLTIQPPRLQAVGLAVQLGGSPVTPRSFLEAMIGTVPAQLTAALGSDMAVLAFGQTESFDAQGAVTPDAPTQTRLAVVIELTDASAANQAMQAWETTGLASASEQLFQYSTSSRLVDAFGGGTYREVAVRYWNFPYADRSLDWAVVLAANGKNYLVLSGSRQAAFFAIDQLMQ